MPRTEHWLETIRRASAAMLSALLAMLAGVQPSWSEAIRIAHAQGETSVASVPTKILTFDLASLETLDAIGVEVSGVVGSHIPAHLAKYQDAKYLKIGSLFEPDYETIHAAAPDLIIVAGRSSPKFAELSRIAPTIDLSVDETTYLASSFRNARTLGKLFGKEDEVESRIAKIETSIKAVREKASHAGRGLIVLTTGGRMSAYGANSRFGTLHTDFGITPAVENLDRAVHGQGVSFELILKANPDWLFVIDRDTAVGQAGQPAAQLLDNPLVARTNAWQKGHVAYLDPVRWYLVGGGLASLQENADHIVRAFEAAP